MYDSPDYDPLCKVINQQQVLSRYVHLHCNELGQVDCYCDLVVLLTPMPNAQSLIPPGILLKYISRNKIIQHLFLRRRRNSTHSKIAKDLSGNAVHSIRTMTGATLNDIDDFECGKFSIYSSLFDWFPVKILAILDTENLSLSNVNQNQNSEKYLKSFPPTCPYSKHRSLFGGTYINSSES